MRGAKKALAVKGVLVSLLTLASCANTSATADRSLTASRSPAFAVSGPVSRIAFGSCLHQDKPQPVWNAILAQQPDVFILGGDNIYADTEDMRVMAEKYSKLAAQPGFQAVRAKMPVLATWDDHDYGKNDAGREYPMKTESRQLFLDFFGEPVDSPRRKRAGIYDAVISGPAGARLQIILLDTRTFRDPLIKMQKGYVPNPDPNATILGAEQWRWLEQQLRQPADLRLVMTSIQFLAEEHIWEKWANFPHERKRMLDLIARAEARGVVFLSGDRHLASISRLSMDAPYPIYEITSSGLNQGRERIPDKDETDRHRIGSSYWLNNFGLLTIDWNARTLDLDIKDDTGNTKLSVPVKF